MKQTRSGDYPDLIVINQTTNPAFNDWLNALVEEVGSLEFWTGKPMPDLNPRIIVRTAAAYDRSSNRRRLQTWLHFTLTVAFRLLVVKRHIPIIVVTNPPFLPLLIWLIHFFFRTPYALIEWDIYPQIAAVMGVLHPNGLAYRLWYKWHQRALSQASMIWTLGDKMAQELRSMLPDSELPIYIVPNWVDIDSIQPIPRAANPFTQEYQLADKFVVLYSGNLGATHSIETILTIAENVQDNPQIHFVIAGEGNKRQLIEAALSSGQLTNLTLLPLQPHEKFLQMLASADVGIVTLTHGYERYSMPSKIYGMLAAGNAILAISAAPNDLAATVNRHECGVNFTETETDLAAAWLREMVNKHEIIEKYQHNARKAAVEFFSAQICIPQLNQIIRNTLLNHEA
jgi:glycosyltransferase involved in cell wall biosynthesis